MTPFFSIVIPLFNKADQIRQTIKSVLGQSYRNFEVIVINDGSTDNSDVVVKKFEDQRIQLYTTENNGVSHARNYGVEKSNGDLIAFLDADDIWLPEHLNELSKLYSNYPNCGMYCTNYDKVFFEKSTLKTKFDGIGNSHFGLVEDYFKASTIDSIGWTSSLAIPKKVFLEFNGFDLKLKSIQDLDLWIRIALKHKVVFSAKVTALKKINNLENHLSMQRELNDTVEFTERFLEHEKNNDSLKHYMDINRFSAAIERKMVKDMRSFNFLKKRINQKTLNYKQRLLLNCPAWLLRQLMAFKYVLIKKNMYASPYR